MAKFLELRTIDGEDLAINTKYINSVSTFKLDGKDVTEITMNNGHVYGVTLPFFHLMNILTVMPVGAGAKDNRND